MNAHRPRDARPLAESTCTTTSASAWSSSKRIRNAACFSTWGLGKTAIALTAVAHLLYDSFEVSRVLMIAPLRVARDTWIAELDKWEHSAACSWSAWLGTPKERIAALSRRADLYVINRENVEWLVRHYAGRKLPFDMLVIDELSSFKNSRAKRFLALKKVLPQFTRVVGLTGTPAPNGLEDLWPQIYLLDRGARLGRTMRSYLDMYFDTPNSWTALQARAEARRGRGHLPAHRRYLRIHAGGGSPQDAGAGGQRGGDQVVRKRGKAVPPDGAGYAAALCGRGRPGAQRRVAGGKAAAACQRRGLR